jgi:sugar lactone lactonase YvrE
MAYGYTIYFSCRSNNRVLCWDPDSGRADILAGEGSPFTQPQQKLKDPYGLAVDPTGGVIIADKLNNRIVRIKGGTFTVVPTLDREDRSHRTSLRDVGFPVTPAGLSLEPDGTLLISYSEDGTIRRLLPNGTLKVAIGIHPMYNYVLSGCEEIVPPPRSNYFPINRPTSIASEGYGHTYFIERGYQLVRRLDANGVLSCVFKPNPHISSPPQGVGATVRTSDYAPPFPTSVALNRHGIVYVADAAHGCVWEVDEPNGIARCIGMSDRSGNVKSQAGPAALAFGPDGVLWILDFGEKRVWGIRPARPDGTIGQTWKRVVESYAIESLSGLATKPEGGGIAIRSA